MNDKKERKQKSSKTNAIVYIMIVVCGFFIALAANKYAKGQYMGLSAVFQK